MPSLMASTEATLGNRCSVLYQFRRAFHLAQRQLEDGLRAQLGLQLSGSILGQQFAVIHDRYPIADLIGFFHVVGGEHHCDAFAAQSFDRVPHGNSALRIEARAGFVEEENGGTMGDGARDLYPLLHAAGELGREAPTPFLQKKL